MEGTSPVSNGGSAEVVEQNQQPAVSPEIAQHLAMAFNEPITPAPGAAPSQQPAAEKEEVFDEPTYLKTNFGFESLDQAKAALDEYKKLKENPPVAQFEFPDETTKKIALALKEDKIDDIYEYVSTQKMLRELETKAPEEKVKAYLKAQNPLFQPEDIEWKFNKLYAVDEDQFKDTNGDVFDEQGLRIAKLEAQQRLQEDIEKATAHFATQKNSVKFPDTIVGDPDYLNYKKMLEEAEVMNKETIEAYKKLSPTDIQANAKFNDEANKLVFDFGYVPDAESFNKAVELASDTSKFFAQYYGKDGSPNRKQFLQDVYFAQNKDKIIGEAMKQAVTATMKWFLARNNGNNNIVRQYPADSGTPIPDELKSHMEMAFAGVNGGRR